MHLNIIILYHKFDLFALLINNLKMIDLKNSFKDKKCFLVRFKKNNSFFIFLYDAEQDTIFLAQEEKEIDLSIFWDRHLKDKEYCLPCELMLYFDKKFIMVVDYPPLEINFPLKEAQKILMELNKTIEIPEIVKNRLLKNEL